MKKHRFGPSIYYASDKNIFDALNQHKVDSATIASLFLTRNVLVGKRTPREELAEYFSRLHHDFYDHKEISARLGIVPRRERVTSMEVTGEIDDASLKTAVDQFKAGLETTGDVLRLQRNGPNLKLEIQYSVVDYKRSEFSQHQVRDGVIELEKSGKGYIVRNTKNDFIDAARDTLLSQLDKLLAVPVERKTVSLFDFPDPTVRSKFFYDLATTLPGYSLRDVTAVYVYKPRPDSGFGNEEVDDDDFDTHVERVHMRGHGVSRSEILKGLLDEDDYYIFRLAWRARELMGKGYEYDIEALFVNPKDCTDFSFILDGIYNVELGKASKQRRPPNNSEIAQISRVVEDRAKDLAEELRAIVAPEEAEAPHDE